MAPKKKKLDLPTASEGGSLPMTTQKDRAAAKKELLSGLKRKFGERVTIGGINKDYILDVIPTGSLTLDIALGVGGIPRGRIIEIAGMESTGKTTLGLKIIANAQKMGYKCAFIDTEFALDPNWATSLGVNMEELDVYEADILEVAGDMLVRLAESGVYDVMVFDSIAATGTNAVHEGDLGDANMGVRARILGQLMEKIKGIVTYNKQWLVMINQLRMTMDQYNPHVAPGGKAVPFAATQRIFLTAKKQKVDSGQEVQYNIVRAKVEKNKVAPPYRVGEYNLEFATGDIDTLSEVADILTNKSHLAKLGVEQSGAWYMLPAELYPTGYPVEKVNGAAKLVHVLSSDVDHAYNVVIPYIRERLIANNDVGSRRHTGEMGPEELSKPLPDEEE